MDKIKILLGRIYYVLQKGRISYATVMHFHRVKMRFRMKRVE